MTDHAQTHIQPAASEMNLAEALERCRKLERRNADLVSQVETLTLQVEMPDVRMPIPGVVKTALTLAHATLSDQGITDKQQALTEITVAMTSLARLSGQTIALEVLGQVVSDHPGVRAAGIAKLKVAMGGFHPAGIHPAWNNRSQPETTVMEDLPPLDGLDSLLENLNVMACLPSSAVAELGTDWCAEVAGMAIETISEATINQPTPVQSGAQQQRNILANAIRDAGVRAGILKPDASISSQALLVIVDDLARGWSKRPRRADKDLVRELFESWLAKQQPGGVIIDMQRGWLAHAESCGHLSPASWPMGTRIEVATELQSLINDATQGEEADDDHDFASAVGDLLGIVLGHIPESEVQGGAA